MDPKPILSNVPGSFPHGVLSRRHPALIRQVRDAYPFPPAIGHALDRLLDETATGRIRPLHGDGGPWTRWGRAYFGRSWFDVPFFWAESYFYRRLLDATGFFGPGAWQGIDPFEPMKAAELADPALRGELRWVESVDAMTPDAQVSAILQASLWGNRADLGFRITRPQAAGAGVGSALVVDDTPTVRRLLADGAPGTVCIVADNAGRELLPDLILADHLLRAGHATRVEMHVKPYPYFVSDATTADLLSCLRFLIAAKDTAAKDTAADGTATETTATADAASAAGRRLWAAMGDGRLVIDADAFYCAPLTFHDMPVALAERFGAAKLTILKGDLNYRRLVGDCDWPATSSFAELTGYFPGPLVALRTLKSEVVVGLTTDLVAGLAASDEHWRTAGNRALIQARI